MNDLGTTTPLNTTEAAARHAEQAKRTTDSWRRHAAVPTMAAQAKPAIPRRRRRSTRCNVPPSIAATCR